MIVAGLTEECMWDYIEGTIAPEIRHRQSGNTTTVKEIQVEELLQQLVEKKPKVYKVCCI